MDIGWSWSLLTILHHQQDESLSQVWLRATPLSWFWSWSSLLICSFMIHPSSIICILSFLAQTILLVICNNICKNFLSVFIPQS